MYKFFLLPTILALILIFLAVPTRPADADWWQRPCIERRFEERTVPIEEVDGVADVHFDATCPTDAPQPEPEPELEAEPTTVPPQDDQNSADDEDPCAPGKSFVGPYCGWSPDHDNDNDDDDNGPRIGGPEVLGLSDTSGSNLILSDILVLSGILCLLTYTKSKLTPASNAAPPLSN